MEGNSQVRNFRIIGLSFFPESCSVAIGNILTFIISLSCTRAVIGQFSGQYSPARTAKIYFFCQTVA